VRATSGEVYFWVSVTVGAADRLRSVADCLEFGRDVRVWRTVIGATAQLTMRWRSTAHCKTRELAETLITGRPSLRGRRAGAVVAVAVVGWPPVPRHRPASLHQVAFEDLAADIQGQPVPGTRRTPTRRRSIIACDRDMLKRNPARAVDPDHLCPSVRKVSAAAGLYCALGCRAKPTFIHPGTSRLPAILNVDSTRSVRDCASIACEVRVTFAV